MTKTPEMRLKEYELGRRLEDVLRECVEAEMTQEQIAEHLDISVSSVRNWIKRLGGQPTLRFKTEENDLAPVG